MSLLFFVVVSLLHNQNDICHHLHTADSFLLYYAELWSLCNVHTGKDIGFTKKNWKFKIVWKRPLLKGLWMVKWYISTIFVYSLVIYKKWFFDFTLTKTCQSVFLYKYASKSYFKKIKRALSKKYRLRSQFTIYKSYISSTVFSK